MQIKKKVPEKGSKVFLGKKLKRERRKSPIEIIIDD